MSDEVSKCVNVWSSDEAFPMINFWNSAKCYKSAHNWPLQHFPGSKSRFSSLYCHIAPPYICRTWKRYNQNCFFSTCHFLDSSKLAITQENGNYITICWHHVIVIFFFFFFFEVVLFLLSGLVTDPSFMSISSLVLELWQFSFKRDWPEILKYPCLNFVQYLETGVLVIELMKCYWLLQNSRIIAFIVSELLRENQQGD